MHHKSDYGNFGSLLGKAKGGSNVPSRRVQEWTAVLVRLYHQCMLGVQSDFCLVKQGLIHLNIEFGRSSESVPLRSVDHAEGLDAGSHVQR